MPESADAWLEELFGNDFEKWLKEYTNKKAVRELQSQQPYLLDLIQILSKFANGASRSYVLDKMQKQRLDGGLPVPKRFDEAVQSCYNQHCIDSAVFRSRKVPDNEALFTSPGGKGSGRWALRRSNAAQWLKAHFPKIEMGE